MSVIKISGLHHVYANGHAGLSNINLNVHDGEFLALLGPSGSGKTTLLRTVAGFLRPSSGTLSIGGTPVAGQGSWVPPERRGLGMVFQNHAIWPHWSVARNVAYPLRLSKVPRKEAAQRVEQILSLVGLDGLGSRSPAMLSGGQRQRVAIARAVVANPQALLLDEALSSLDEPLRARLRLELKALTRSRGLTAVHVTHDRAEALALADRVVVLRHGRIEQVGSPQDLLQRPETAFVAGFVQDAALLQGTLAGGRLQLGHGWEVPADRLHGSGALRGTAALHGNGAVTAAVSPLDFALHPLQGPEDSTGRAARASWPAGAAHPQHAGAGQALVTSALYGPHGFDVSVDFNGIPLRAHVSGWVPRVGDVVQPEILRAHVFAPEHDGTGSNLPADAPTVDGMESSQLTHGPKRRRATVPA